MSMVAVIPVKEKSERVQSKNFRRFVDTSLIELKIQQIIDSNSFDDIYISSNSCKANELAEKYKLKHIARDSEFCNNTMPWSEVIHKVVSSIPVDNNCDLAWCHVTSPLFSGYKECVYAYNNLDMEKYDGLVTVVGLNEFILSEKARPVNYNWGVWHEYSQYLDKLYAITGALFIAKKSEMLRNRYVVSKKPYLYEVSDYESIDIDTEYDFKLAEIMYKNKEILFNVKT